MKKLNLYAWITNNYWIKLSCFFLAILLWYSTTGGIFIVRDFSISITFENISEDLVISAQSTKNIFITVQGDRRTVLKCQATAFYLPIDLAKIKEAGTYSYDLIPDKVIAPTGIKVISIEPQKVILTLRKKE
ncbi:MAG: CdaR family protein [bacterium]